MVSYLVSVALPLKCQEGNLLLEIDVQHPPSIIEFTKKLVDRVHCVSGELSAHYFHVHSSMGDAIDVIICINRCNLENNVRASSA